MGKLETNFFQGDEDEMVGRTIHLPIPRVRSDRLPSSPTDDVTPAVGERFWAKDLGMMSCSSVGTQ